MLLQHHNLVRTLWLIFLFYAQVCVMPNSCFGQFMLNSCISQFMPNSCIGQNCRIQAKFRHWSILKTSQSCCQAFTPRSVYRGKTLTTGWSEQAWFMPRRKKESKVYNARRHSGRLCTQRQRKIAALKAATSNTYSWGPARRANMCMNVNR